MKPIYYDAKRPASSGRWIVITKGVNIIAHTPYMTEEAAKAAAKES